MKTITCSKFGLERLTKWFTMLFFLGHYTEKRPCFLGIAWNLKIIIFWLSSCKNDECHSFSWIIEHCKTKSHLAARFLFFSTVFQSWGQVLFITMCGSLLSNEVRVMIATYIRTPLQHLVILKISPRPHFAWQQLKHTLETSILGKAIDGQLVGKCLFFFKFRAFCKHLSVFPHSKMIWGHILKEVLRLHFQTRSY